MPLNETQKLFIKDSIKFFLDEIPKKAQTFQEFEKNLTQAVLDPRDNLFPTTHELALVRSAMRNPLDYYVGLEKRGPKVNVGEVQEYLFECISALLLQSGNTPQHWIKSNIIDQYKSDNTLWNTPFTDKKKFIDASESPWSLPSTKGKIYTQQIQESATRVSVQVHVSCGQVKTSRNEFLSLIDLYTIDESLVNKLKQLAIEKAFAIAAELALQHFRNKSPLNRVPADKCRRLNHILLLLVDEYYFQKLDKGEISFNFISTCNKTQSEILLLEPIIHLQARDVTTFQDILQMTAPESWIVCDPYYHELIVKRLIKVDDFKGVDHWRAVFMLNPHIISMQKKGIFNFKYALTIPPPLAHVFYHPAFPEIFKNKPLPWEDLLKLTDNQARYLSHRVFLTMIAGGKTTIPKLVPVIEPILDTYPYILIWLNAGIITGDSFISHNNQNEIVKHLHFLGCFQRLLAISRGNPTSFDTGTDSIVNAKNDLYYFCEYFGNELLEYVAFNLLQNCKHELSNMKKTLSSELTGVADDIIKFIPEKTEKNWFLQFGVTIKKIEERVRQMENPPASLFSFSLLGKRKKAETTSKLFTFCKRFLDTSPILEQPRPTLGIAKTT